MSGRDYMDDRIAKENLEAYEKLLNAKAVEDKGRKGGWHYWQDLYGNTYAYYTYRQADGKFHAFIRTKKKTRYAKFAKKKRAVEWAYKNYEKHNTKQVQARESRRAKAEARKPKYTIDELKYMALQKKVDHHIRLLVKNEKKIKALRTRSKTYNRRLKYYQKKKNELMDAQNKLLSAGGNVVE